MGNNMVIEKSLVSYEQEIGGLLDNMQRDWTNVCELVAEVHSSGIYKEKYSTVEEWAEKAFGWDRTKVYRLIEACRVNNTLVANWQQGGIKPNNESQIRYLTNKNLETDDIVAVWQNVSKKVEKGEKLTAKLVQQEVKEYLYEPEKEVTPVNFHFRASNFWKFPPEAEESGFKGGISSHIIGNLIYYHSMPDSVVIDPMAGSGRTKKVIEGNRYFQEVIESDIEFTETKIPAKFSGKRHVLLSDFDPQNDSIEKADVRFDRPFGDDVADLIIVDPPYWKIAENYYNCFGETIEEWRNNIALLFKNQYGVLKDGGKIALIVDDYLRSKEFHPLAGYILLEALSFDLKPVATYYNPFPNFSVSMGAIQMWRAKQARLAVNSMKIIQVFQK